MAASPIARARSWDHRDRPRASAPSSATSGSHGPRRGRQGDRAPGRGPARPAFGIALAPLGDAGSWRRRRLALTTDAFVVRPLRFPGGSIGELAVNGTVNDLAMSGRAAAGARAALILEEGLRGRRSCAPKSRRCAAAAARRSRGRRRRHEGRRARPRRRDVHHARPASAAATRARALRRGLRPGDRILLSRARSATTAWRSCSRAASSSWTPTIVSDTRSLWPAVDALLGRRARPALHARRDPRRRGLRAQRARARAGVAMMIHEAAVPVAPAVAGAAELLGIDPMYVANEGKLVAFVAPEAADAALAALGVPGGEAAADIGEVRTEPPGMVLVETALRRQAGDGRTGRRPAAEDLLMHELSIADAIVRIAPRHARGRRVETRRGQGRAPAPGRARRARVRVRRSSPRARALEGARTGLEIVPARRPLPRAAGPRANCAGFPLRCAACGGLDVELVRGEELLVDALEIERLTMEGWPWQDEAGGRGGRHPLDLGGDELRRRLCLDHGRRRSRASRTSCSARSRGCRRSTCTTRCSRRRSAARSSWRRSARPPAASSTRRSCSSSRARSRTRTSTATATGPRSATTRRPASR